MYIPQFLCSFVNGNLGCVNTVVMNMSAAMSLRYVLWICTQKVGLVVHCRFVFSFLRNLHIVFSIGEVVKFPIAVMTVINVKIAFNINDHLQIHTTARFTHNKVS